MKINIGTTNPSKVDAVKEIISDYPSLKKAQISTIDVPSGVSKQPKGLKEITTGAINRAKSSFKDCDYSFGIESGLMEVPNTKTGFMDICLCCIYDGKETHLGTSCAFELPLEMIKKVKEENLDLSEATYKLGLSKSKNIGAAERIIGILTKNRVSRKEYTKQSIQMALIQIENKELY